MRCFRKKRQDKEAEASYLMLCQTLPQPLVSCSACQARMTELCIQIRLLYSQRDKKSHSLLEQLAATCPSVRSFEQLATSFPKKVPITLNSFSPLSFSGPVRTL